MQTFDLISLSVYLTGALAYGSSATRAAGFARIPRATRIRAAPRLDLFLMALCFVWFANAALIEVLRVVGGDPRPFRLLSLGFAYCFPPTILHSVYIERRERLRSPVWGWFVPVMYTAAVAATVWTTAVLFGWLRAWNLGLSVSSLVWGLFGVLSVYALLAIRASGPSHDRRAGRSDDVADVGLFSGLFLLTLVLAAGAVFAPGLERFLSLVATSLPLAFLTVGTYRENRYEFFDVLVKRTLALGATVAAFTVWLRVAGAAWASAPSGSWRGAWFAALVIAPVAIATPWIHRRLGAWFDGVWLDRRFDTLGGIKHFLDALEGTTTEDEVVASAEEGLRAIFGAAARVAPVADGSAADEDRGISAPLRGGGRVSLEPRANRIPYFSEDIRLLESLADVLSSVLENARLQERKRQQERVARDMRLAASRSELKALRAQINPHFLFNALNAVAGLIHKDPALADRTVEQLAEMFRYTLQGSEREWSRLSEELAFVSAYLDIERARFGARLDATIDVAADVEDPPIPALMLHTLVENAIKHGVARVPGTVRVEIEATRDGDRIRIDVRDSGPGPDAESRVEARTGSTEGIGRPGEPAGTGFGLRSVRERLASHYGDRGRLSLARDEERGLTVAAIEFPTVPAAGSVSGR